MYKQIALVTEPETFEEHQTLKMKHTFVKLHYSPDVLKLLLYVKLKFFIELFFIATLLSVHLQTTQT
jgi:hypothetical protein